MFVVQHMAQTVMIKTIILVSGLVWAIGTIIWIMVASNYFKLWQKWFNELREDKMRRISEGNPEYMELRRQYPLSVKRHEQHYLKKRPRVSCDEILEKALKVKTEEWVKREEFHLANRKERLSYDENKPPELHRNAPNAGRRL